MIRLFGLALACAFPALAADPPAFKPLDYVTFQTGKIPILISAPHGGGKDVPGATPRTGEGLAKGPSGFFTGRDLGSEELAYAIAEAVEKKFGAKPYLVVAKFHRKFIDANRPPEIG